MTARPFPGQLCEIINHDVDGDDDAAVTCPRSCHDDDDDDNDIKNDCDDDNENDGKMVEVEWLQW